MYDDAVLRIPRDEPELWEILREQFFHVAEDFARPIETKEDALGNRFHRDHEGKTLRDGLMVIRYRHVGNELDNREHFLAMGRELVPYIAEALSREKLSPEFIQQWGKLMFCHGYITSHVLDDSDDSVTERNRRRGTQASKQTAGHAFLARLILKFMDERQEPRKRAEALAARAIYDFLKRDQAAEELDLEWLKRLAPKEDRIVSTLSQKKASDEKIRALAASDDVTVPSIELLFPSN
jgi:hypothetical protein